MYKVRFILNRYTFNMNKTILIVEDNKTLAMYQKSVLSALTTQILVVHSLEELRELFKINKNKISIAIVDINLPVDEDGALDFLLKHNIPSIAMTNSFNKEFQQKSYTSSIIDYIVVENDSKLELLYTTVERTLQNKKSQILIVDDSKASRFALHELLKYQNFEVIEVEDPTKAIDTIKEHSNIKIALLDYEMPKLNGIELTREIRKFYSRMELAILAISVNRSPMVTIEFLKAGANDFITKPYVKDEVIARVNITLDMIYQHETLQKEILERKKVESELEYAKNKAEIASQSKSTFLANMSHEIRTPMNAIMGFIDILYKKENSTKKKEKLSIIRDAANSLLTIINDILDFSKIESGKLGIENISFTTLHPFKLTTELFIQKAKEKEIKIVLNADEAIPEKAFGDPIRIQQIYSNLLSNAIKFSPEKSQIDVNLLYDKNSSKLICSVRDSGIGIAQENIGKIFTPFEQEDNSTSRRFGGTGLGLSISKSLINMMNGELKVTSVLGEGSTFTFSLDIFHKTIHQTETNRKIFKRLETPSMLHGKVLLVEDNKANQLLMKILLEERNLEVDIANDGLEAISAYSANHYDIILMDENMPNMGGIEASKEIQMLESYKEQQTPIIAVTANALSEDKKRFLNAGMHDYIAKPINQDELDRVLYFYLT